MTPAAGPLALSDMRPEQGEALGRARQQPAPVGPYALAMLRRLRTAIVSLNAVMVNPSGYRRGTLIRRLNCIRQLYSPGCDNRLAITRTETEALHSETLIIKRLLQFQHPESAVWWSALATHMERLCS